MDYYDLGSYTRKVTTATPEAQLWFDRGLNWLFGFNHGEAIKCFQKALEHDGPALVEVLVSRQELSMPPTITAEQVKGFSLFTLKAVLSGRGDEIVDLAKINLFR